MQSTGSTDRKDAPAGEGTDRVGKPISKDDVSGLHEIKALAATTIDRQRIRRSTEQPIQAEAEAMMNAQSPAAVGSVMLAQPGRESRIELPAMMSPEVVQAQPVATGHRRSRRALYAALVVVVLVGAGAAAFMISASSGGSAPTAASAAPMMATTAQPQPGPIEAVKPPPVAAVAPAVADAPADTGEQHKDNDQDQDQGGTTPATQAAPPPGRHAEKAVAGIPAGHAEPAISKDHPALAEDKPVAVKAPDKTAPDKTAVEAATKPDAKTAKDEELGDLLDGQTDTKPVAVDPALPASLTPDDIRSGMAAVRGAAQACYGKFQAKGLVKIRAKISPAGQVTSAEASGDFAGTPTGACVAAAVKGAHFPKVSGQGLTVTYPFMLAEE
jgi:hypothetical protein